MESRLVTSANKLVMRDVVPGAQAQTELTISSGAVEPTRGSHTIDTEGDAASDDLDTITLTNLRAGDVVRFTPESASRVVTVKHGTDNITTIDGQDIVMDALTKTIQFEVDAAGTGVVASLVSGTTVLDEDDFSSDSATNPPSQQSTKAYVDAKTAPLPNDTASSELTISSGAITLTGPHHTVDTEGDGATDDLTDITWWAGVKVGSVAYLSAENVSRVVTIKSNTGSGKIKTEGDADFALDSSTKVAVIQWDGTQTQLLSADVSLDDKDASSALLTTENSTLARALAERENDAVIHAFDFFADDEAAIVARIKARTVTTGDAEAIHTAIQAAVDYAEGLGRASTVFLGRGKWFVDDTVVVDAPRVWIKGAGREQTELVMSPSVPAGTPLKFVYPTPASTTDRMPGNGIAHLTLGRNDQSGTGGWGLQVHGCGGFIAYDFKISNVINGIEELGGQGCQYSNFSITARSTAALPLVTDSAMMKWGAYIANSYTVPSFYTTIEGYSITANATGTHDIFRIEEADGWLLGKGTIARAKRAHFHFIGGKTEWDFKAVHIGAVYSDGLDQVDYGILFTHTGTNTDSYINEIRLSGAFIGNYAKSCVKVDSSATAYMGTLSAVNTTFGRSQETNIIFEGDGTADGSALFLTGCVVRDGGLGGTGDGIDITDTGTVGIYGGQIKGIPGDGVVLTGDFTTVDIATAFVDITGSDVDQSSKTSGTVTVGLGGGGGGSGLTHETITPRLAGSGGSANTYTVQSGDIYFDETTKSGWGWGQITLSALNITGDINIADFLPAAATGLAHRGVTSDFLISGGVDSSIDEMRGFLDTASDRIVLRKLTSGTHSNMSVSDITASFNIIFEFRFAYTT